LHPSDVPLDIKPVSFHLEDSGLCIVWESDQHVTHYDLGWLADYAYDQKNSDRQWKPDLWDASLDLNSVSHSYVAVRTDSEKYFGFLRSLRDYGIAIIRRDSAEAVGIEVMSSFIGDIAEAAYEKVFEINPQVVAHTYGNSMQPIPPHTDEAYLHTPTGILTLYCVNPASEGGESVLVDGFMLCEQLRKSKPQAFDILSRCPQTYHRIVPEKNLNYLTRARAITVDEKENLVGFRFHPRAMAPSDVSRDLARDLHAANHALSELMLNPDNQLCFELEAGDAVFFDNHRVMHSRKRFSDPNRHLQICNVSREAFHQKVRLTAMELGYRSEALQYLPAGVSG
jgi:alpha-ketoglutarate-dependent taurine dioxygenase